MSLSALPEGCVRARCGCSWWIATHRQIGTTLCRACGVRFMIAMTKDFEAVGVDPTVIDAPKKKKGKK